MKECHPGDINPASAKLADAQLVLARSYQTSSWMRLVQAVQLADAIWRDDIDRVRDLVTGNPRLIHEDVLIRRDSNWSPPMTYAANLGRDRIIRMLHGLGATDLESAAGRAALQGKIETARMLYDMAGRPPIREGALGGPAYTLSAQGTALLISLGARVCDDYGRRRAPVDVVLETDARNPTAKHSILEMYAQHGLELPDTPTMALHRGRIDLLEEHLQHDDRNWPLSAQRVDKEARRRCGDQQGDRHRDSNGDGGRQPETTRADGQDWCEPQAQRSKDPPPDDHVSSWRGAGRAHASRGVIADRSEARSG